MVRNNDPKIDKPWASLVKSWVVVLLTPRGWKYFFRMRSTSLHQQAQIRVPSHLGILFLTLLIGMSPDCCSGARAIAHLECSHLPSPQTCLTQTVDARSRSFAQSLSTPKDQSHSSTMHNHQRSRLNPKRNSKAPLKYASKLPPKAIV